MSQTVVTVRYGTIFLNYKCQSCGQIAHFEYPRYAAGAALGVAEGAARERANTTAKKEIANDRTLVAETDPIEFFKNSAPAIRPCRSCGFVQKWQRSLYREQYCEFLSCVTYICFVMLALGYGYVAVKLFDVGMKVVALVGVSVCVAGLPVAVVIHYIVAPKMLRSKLRLMDEAAGDTRRTRPELTFVEA